MTGRKKNNGFHENLWQKRKSLIFQYSNDTVIIPLIRPSVIPVQKWQLDKNLHEFNFFSATFSLFSQILCSGTDSFNLFPPILSHEKTTKLPNKNSNLQLVQKMAFLL